MKPQASAVIGYRTPRNFGLAAEEGVTRLAHPYATRGEVGGLAPGAYHSDDVGRRHAAGQKTLNREMPKVS